MIWDLKQALKKEEKRPDLVPSKYQVLHSYDKKNKKELESLKVSKLDSGATTEDFYSTKITVKSSNK